MKRSPIQRKTPLRAKRAPAPRRSAIKAKAKPAVPAAEKRHLARLAAMPCIVTGKRPVQVHHVTGYADRMGRLPRLNSRTVPLHFSMHKHEGGPLSVERLNHRGFYAEHGVDLYRESVRLWAESEAMEAMR